MDQNKLSIVISFCIKLLKLFGCLVQDLKINTFIFWLECYEILLTCSIKCFSLMLCDSIWSFLWTFLLNSPFWHLPCYTFFFFTCNHKNMSTSNYTSKNYSKNKIEKHEYSQSHSYLVLSPFPNASWWFEMKFYNRIHQVTNPFQPPIKFLKVFIKLTLFWMIL
jgi:hypothetical protein